MRLIITRSQFTLPQRKARNQTKLSEVHNISQRRLIEEERLLTPDVLERRN